MEALVGISMCFGSILWLVYWTARKDRDFLEGKRSEPLAEWVAVVAVLLVGAVALFILKVMANG